MAQGIFNDTLDQFYKSETIAARVMSEDIIEAEVEQIVSTRIFVQVQYFLSTLQFKQSSIKCLSNHEIRRSTARVSIIHAVQNIVLV